MEELTLNELYVILDQYIDMIRIWELDKNDRPRKLSIGGGEPFVRRELFDFLKKINENREIFSSVGIMSNGSMITRNVAKRLKRYEISGVQISLEGPEDVNDKLRGEKSFKKAVNGIKNLMEVGIPVGVSVTIHRENYRDFPDLLNFLKDVGVKSIGVSRLVPIGMGKNLEILKPKELNEFYSFVMSKKKELGKEGICLSTHCSDSIWFIEDRNHETHGCSAGYDSFSILSNGDVVPCRRFPVKVGNVLERSLIDIWYTSDFLWKLRNKGNIFLCKKCEFFSKCFGGARCVAYGYFNNVFAPDPQCWKLFNSLPRKTTSSAATNDPIIFNEAYIENFNSKK
jgi:radical SAM protein with 4Fe4S-binding SPASM domain